jgi:hypothetical protein
MASSTLMHDLTKFSSQGLQLRLPVDLIPAGQYGRLTNAIPVIEGILQTREGMTFIADFNVAFQITALSRSFLNGTVADTIFLDTPTNFFTGQWVIVTILDGEGFFANGTYVTQITSVSGNNPINVFPYISAPGFTTPGADVIHTAAGTVTTIGQLSEAAIHTIHRLNESVSGVIGSRLVGAGIVLFSADLPTGNVFNQVPVFLSGRPLSLIDFRFTLDTATWAIFTDGTTQYKYRKPYTFLLGNPFPTVPAQASAGGAGNLNSTGGADYDWRYTYFDGYVSTEGNPSGSPDSGVIEAKTSTSQINPNPAHNTGGAFPYTNHAFTGVSNTGGIGHATQDGGKTPITANFFNQASCIWKGFAAPTTTPFVITLSITWSAVIIKPSFAPIEVLLQYSTNGGVTFSTFAGTTVTVGETTSTVNLPLGTNLTQVQFGVWGFCNPNDIPPFRSGGSFTVTVTNIEIDTNLSPTPTVLNLVNKMALVCVAPPPPPSDRITAIRLYRRGGSLPDNWRLVGTFPISGLVQGGCGANLLEITDDVSDTTLSTQPILELDNDQPVTSVSVINQALKFFWGPAGIEARMLGCGDPARPESVYFSKPGNADAWPPQNHVEVCSPGTPVIAGCVFNTRIFAFSNEGIFELVEGLNPTAVYTPFPTPSTHGLISPWGLVSATAMFFVAKDGIYMSDGGQEVSIVENDIKPIFPTYDGPGRSVEEYEAVDMSKVDNIRLAYHNDELYFIYSGLTTGIRQTLVYDTLKKRWRAVKSTTAISTVYSEPAVQSSLLIGNTAGGLYQSLGAFDPNTLDVIETADVSQVVLASTLLAGDYFVVVTRLTIAGIVAQSFEFGPIAVDGTHAIQAIFPIAPSGTTAWRVYYGITQGAEGQYQEFAENVLPLNRTVNITTAGTAGTIPTNPPSSAISVNIRTGARDQGAPLNRKQYSNAIFDLDAQGNVITITPYIDGEEQVNAAITTTSLGRDQIPLDLSDFFAFNLEYQITWDSNGSTPVLYQFDTLWFSEPVSVKHWYAQPTSFGIAGYMHIRDMYISIRSDADAIMSVTMDETTTQTYTIPSTGGKRSRVYIQLDSNKAKEYQISVDSEAEFSIYDEDVEVRVKGWLGLLGYQITKSFAEAGQ